MSAVERSVEQAVRASAVRIEPGAAQRLTVSLARLSAGARVLGVAPDRVELTAPGPAALIAELRAAADRPELRAVQAEIAEQAARIDRVASGAAANTYFVTGVAPQVTGYEINRAELTPGQRLDVNVEVTQSAQTAALFLDFGAPALNLQGGVLFRVEIAGERGAQTLSFVSGTSVSSLAAAIDTFAAITGVRASVVDGSVRLVGEAPGSEEFISVRVLSNGGLLEPSGAGIRRAHENDGSLPDLNAPAISFLSTEAQAGVTAQGRDVQGTINGIAATGRGTTLSIDTRLLALGIELRVGGDGPHAQRLGAFRALTIIGARGPALPTAPVTPINGQVIAESPADALAAVRAQLLANVERDEIVRALAGDDARNRNTDLLR